MKKRVIRLTESELKRYINKVVSEQSYNALAVAKEVLQNIIAGKHLFPIKTMPGYVGAHITNDPDMPYEQNILGDSTKSRKIKINVFKVGNGVANVIFKNLSIGDRSVNSYNAKDESDAKATDTDCPDISSYLQYLNTTPPNGKLSKLNLSIDNYELGNFELWKLTHYCVSAGVSVKEMLDVLTPFSSNIAKDIIDTWSFQNVNYNPNKGWDPNDQKLLQQVKEYVNQPAAPAQGQKPVTPTTPQTKKPINEGQEILKDVFKSLIK